MSGNHDDRPTLQIRGLRLALGSGTELVSGVDLDLAPGKILALVGESGSGKTLIGRSILGLLPGGIAQTGGEIVYRGARLDSISGRELRELRGGRIGMIFQEPLVSLNPALRIGEQMAEGLRLHRRMARAEIRRRSIEMLRRIHLPDPEAALNAFPHEFSGGMRQRIMLASVMLLEPDLLIADEPTTALDTLSQQEVLQTMVDLTTSMGAGVLLITHDIGVVARYADEVVVLRQGEAVERGPAAEVVSAARNAYTRALVEAAPRKGEVPAPAVLGDTVLEARNLRLTYSKSGRLFRRTSAKPALDGVSFQIRRGETVAVVGASGSGKTTLGRALLRLVDVDEGSIRHHGEEIARASDSRLVPFRRSCQIVFQDPFSSLDPRMRVAAIVAESLRGFPSLSSAERKARAETALADAGLPGLSDRLPHQLSGGQRQRVAIARAIAREPELVVADEPISALDMTVQKQILDLFARLQAEHQFACVFISHDLAAVQRISHRIVVMEAGRIVEEGPSAQVLSNPGHAFTRRLIEASPSL